MRLKPCNKEVKAPNKKELSCIYSITYGTMPASDLVFEILATVSLGLRLKSNVKVLNVCQHLAPVRHQIAEGKANGKVTMREKENLI